jgi:hypothetical protein
MNERRLPHDRDLERSVLAEIVDPLHDVRALGDVAPNHFCDGRHQRILRHWLAGEQLNPSDELYVADITRWAHPLARGDVERFFWIAERRRRVLALANEIEDLLTGWCAA